MNKFQDELAKDIDGGLPSSDGIFPTQVMPPSREGVIRAIAIGLILPDLTQPRRALPAALSYRGPGIDELLSNWWGMAEDEAGTAIEALHIIRGRESGRSQTDGDRQLDHIEKSFMELVELAATIYKDGLINPITIYLIAPEHKAEQLYQIETGERRWLAYNLLAWLTEEPKWQAIPARLVDTPNVWRQAHENTARSNLNAIGLARQMALLLLDMYSHEPFNLSFQPYDAFEHDRGFYAQVADGHEYPVPYGEGEKLLAAMGVKNIVQLRQYRALLRLPDHIWTTGDEESWGVKSLVELLSQVRQITSAPESVSALTHSPQSDDSITLVSPSPTSIEVATPDSQSTRIVDDESAEMQSDVQESAVAPWAAEFLKAAYKIGQRGFKGWFASIALGTTPQRLNEIAAMGYLDCKASGNTNYSAAVYRIAAAGCIALGLPTLKFDEPARRDPGQTPTDDPLNGTQPQGGKPPVAAPRRPKRLFDANVERQFKLLLSFTDVQAEEAKSRGYVLAMLRSCRDIIESAIEGVEAAELIEEVRNGKGVE